MKRGYIKLWRKIDDCKALREPGKVYSKKEAWIHIVMNMASGIDDGNLRRGEFEASYRYLAKAWRWDVHKTYRFMASLITEKMLQKVQHPAQHPAQQDAQHFKVCNYETYNPSSNTSDNTPRNTQRNKLKECIKESKKEGKTTTQVAGATAVDPSPFGSEAERLSELLRSRIAVRDGNAKAAKLPVPPGWVSDIDKLLRIDGRSPEDVEKVILWCQIDGCFWGPNVMSGRKLREKFDTMWGQIKRDSSANNPTGSKPDTVGQNDSQPPTDHEFEENLAEARRRFIAGKL